MHRCLDPGLTLPRHPRECTLTTPREPGEAKVCKAITRFCKESSQDGDGSHGFERAVTQQEIELSGCGKPPSCRDSGSSRFIRDPRGQGKVC